MGLGNPNELSKLEKQLQLLYEQLEAIEQEILLAQDPIRKIQCKQRIREEIAPDIAAKEQAYLQALNQWAQGPVAFAEGTAEGAIEAVTEVVATVRKQGGAELDAEILKRLEAIEAKLNEPDTTAAAKLKATLSLVPPFVGLAYEAELDTENFVRAHFPFRAHFPTFRRLVKGAKKLMLPPSS